MPSTALNASLVSDVAKDCAEIALNQKASVHPLCAVLETPEGATSHAPDSSLTYTIYSPTLADDFGASGFSTSYMYAIEQAHLKLQRIYYSWTDYEDVKVVVEDLPGWLFSKMTDDYRSEFFYTMFLVFTVTAMRRLGAIAYELSTGLAEKQALMGLTAVQFSAGHFFTALAFYIVECIIVITTMYTVTLTDDVTAYASGINPLMVIVSFLLFVVGQSTVPVFVTAVFPKGWVRMLLFAALLVVAPATVSPGLETVPQYLTRTRRSKLFAGTLPQSGLISVMMIMFLAQDYEGGADLSVVTRRVMGNNVTILEIWLVVFFSDVGIVFLTWYLPQILPWCSDNPRSPLFLITFIGTVPVLNGLDLDVYERKVTVLLGHNAAGKSTLMSILTGTLGGPTSGTAIVCGHDVYSDREMVHSEVALCQQSDIFFEDLTCGENALYFAALKEGHGTDVQKATASMLTKMGLEGVRDKMPGEVSSGTLRMLSLAIAIASQPKLLMLDEPTSGMDLVTRRKIWDILQKVGRETTLMFSSHDMFEADAVADHIVIMAAGTVICSGSTTFLKRTCGVGYTITLVKEPRLFNEEGALAVIRKVIPGAHVHSDGQSTVAIRLGTSDHTGFPALFKTLERSSKRLGIADIGLTVATVKDVYIKINYNWTPEAHTIQTDTLKGDDVAVLCKPVSKGHRTSAQCFKALFIKRLTYLRRSSGIFLMLYVLPLVLLWLLLELAPPPKSTPDDQELYHLYGTSEIRLGYNFPAYTVVLQGGAAASLSRALMILVEAEGCKVLQVSDVDKIRIGYDLATYIRTYPMAIVLEPDRIRLVVDPANSLTVPVLLNLVDTAVLRLVTRQRTAHIVARVSQLELRQSTSRVSVFMFWTVGCAATYALAFSAFAAFPAAERVDGARDIQLMTGLSGGFFVFSHAAFDFVHCVAFAVPWCLIYRSSGGNSFGSLALIFATFVLSSPAMIGMAYLTAERALTELGAVYSQFMWIYFSGIVLFLGTRVFNALGVEVMQYATLLFPPWALLACLLKISSADIAAELCGRQRAAPSLPSLSNLPSLPGGAPVIPTVSARAWRAIFRTWRNALAADNEEDADIYTPLWYSSPCDQATPLSFTHNGVLPELLFLLLNGLICLGIASYITSGYFSVREAIFGHKWTRKGVNAAPSTPAQDARTTPTRDPNVEEEKQLAIALCDTKDFSAHALVVCDLCKSFGESCAVRDFNLALRPSECLGLLGVQGSGKTTTLNLLAALAEATYGEAYTTEASMQDNVRKWQSQISYCQQNGGLLDKLNAYEFLYLVARLRGVSPNDLEAAVNCVISIIDIKDNASKPCGIYSIEECQSSCNRIAIMSDGQLKCLGTLQQLRDKYARGYRLEFKLKHEAEPNAAEQLKEAVQQNFAGAKLVESLQNVITYNLPERLPWSKLFRKVALLEKDFPLEYAIGGENTLEQVFLSLVGAEKGQ
uniref:ATP-binding cassette, subfamily A (ABC1), member 3 n=1 Tax=Rhipicephalus appendiculatus TaxID=34631 RepID=A0A131YXM7_RHIAP